MSEPFSAPGPRSLVAFEEELVRVTSESHPVVKRATGLGRATILAFSQGCLYRSRLEEWFALTASSLSVS